MSEPESIREIARNLIAQYRERKGQREKVQDINAQELVEALRDIPSPAVRFDIDLTENDCRFLRSIRIKPE